MDISIVIPVFNEEGNIANLFSEIMIELEKRPEVLFEVLFIDDGSTDDSWRILSQLASNNIDLKAIKLSRNFGQTAAMYCGFQLSTGKVIIPLDSDGQNVPSDIFPLYDTLIEGGFDCVSGWRAERKDKGLTRKLPSYFANKLLAKTTGVMIHDSGCTIKAYSGDLLRSVPLYGEMHRLVPFYIFLAGGSISEIKVGHRPRTSGKSKYGLSRTFRVLQDILVAKVQYGFSSRPMHLFGNVALFSFLTGAFLFITAVLLKLLSLKDLVETPLLVLSTLFLLASLQILTSGLIAEMLVRQLSYQENNQTFRIKQKLNYD